jgi:hypothetical protein
MFYRLPLLLVLLLAGCSAKPGSAPLPEPLPLAKPDAAASFGDKQDKADAKIGAAVQAAREANAASKPAVVESELSVAAAFLPPVPEGDLALARARSAAADPKAYAEAVAKGKRLNDELQNLWAKMEAQQAQAKADIAELRSQVEGHKAKAEAERKDKIAAQLGLAGAAMLGAGVLLLAFGGYIGVSKFSAALVMVGGAAVASLPWVFDSAYFPWIAGGAFALAALQVTIALAIKLWRWARPPQPAADPAEYELEDTLGEPTCEPDDEPPANLRKDADINPAQSPQPPKGPTE